MSVMIQFVKNDAESNVEEKNAAQIVSYLTKSVSQYAFTFHTISVKMVLENAN